MWNLENTHIAKNKRLIDSENRLVVARSKGLGWWEKWTKGVQNLKK